MRRKTIRPPVGTRLKVLQAIRLPREKSERSGSFIPAGSIATVVAWENGGARVKFDRFYRTVLLPRVDVEVL